MNRIWMRFSTVGLLAAALWVTGCTDRTAPSDRLMGPDAVSFAKGGNGKAKSDKAPKVNGKKNGKPFQWTAVIGKMPAPREFHTQAVVDGSRDVVIENNGHYLLVPRGTVSEPTTFRIKAYKKVVDPVEGLTEVAVELRAFTIDPETGEEIDAGADGFDGNRVYLGLTYSWAENFDPADATILWLKPSDSGYEGIPVDVVHHDSTRRFLIAELHHFSDYILAVP